MTWLYLKCAGRLNWILGKFGLILFATFEGDPPNRPYRVVGLSLQRRGPIAL